MLSGIKIEKCCLGTKSKRMKGKSKKNQALLRSTEGPLRSTEGLCQEPQFWSNEKLQMGSTHLRSQLKVKMLFKTWSLGA